MIVAGALLGAVAVAAVCFLKKEQENADDSAGATKSPRSHHLTKAFAQEKPAAKTES